MLKSDVSAGTAGHAELVHFKILQRFFSAKCAIKQKADLQKAQIQTVFVQLSQYKKHAMRS